jgi:hypothetical protein
MPAMHQPNLLLFTISIYGLAWLITKSKLIAPIRDYLSERSQLAGDLLSCIVCTSVWICIAVMACSPAIPILQIRPALGDVPILLGWTMGSTWLLARLVGDAD